ncbi:MAG: exodeoxyribonuclease VII small subunit [Bacillota bacterium]|nr:exodeoxyribonuclease VII small subunit [Bacillota bacterium]
MKFESALKKLEEIVAKLESGEVTLDEAMELYLAGVGALKNCEKLLTEAEHKVEILLRDERTAFVEG